MLPVFNEFIQFIKDTATNVNEIDLHILSEGYFWIDNKIIKAYDSKAKLRNFYKLVIDDNLNMSLKPYKKFSVLIESWEDTLNRNQKRLRRLEKCATKLIEVAIKKYYNYCPAVLYSGGKDSMVVNYLVQQVVPAEIIFNNTSLDCADTYRHIKQLKKTLPEVTIVNPNIGFYNWVRQSSSIVPNRINRSCCYYFKEKPLIDKISDNQRYIFFMGMRNEESATRSQYKNKWFNEVWGYRDWLGILPIRKWTEEDVWLYIFWKNLDFNKKYRKGYSRVGCHIACPFCTKTTWTLDKYWYPNLFNRWHKILEEDFINNYKWIRLNCTLSEYHLHWNGSVLRPSPTDEVINEFAKYMNIDFDTAKKYFNKTCKICGKNLKNKDEIAMNLKMLGRNIDEYYCKKHLTIVLDINEHKWDELVKEFKQSDCTLF